MAASQPPSPTRALIVLPQADRETEAPAWHPILSVSNQVVLYNPTSHALSVRPHTALPPSSCPYCHRPMEMSAEFEEMPFETHNRAQNYFQLLEIVNETSSRPPTPGLRSVSSASGSSNANSQSTRDEGGGGDRTFAAEAMAEGYFKAFFREEHKLGMGANGSVFLCQHVLDGNPLGHFAVKKIAVGQSHSYLLQILREVRLLESLRHPNIITYHHAWLESCKFSSFGLRVPTLFVLMQWAEGGSLDDFIDARRGRPHIHQSPDSGQSSSHTHDLSSFRTRSARIRAFRAAQKMPQEEHDRRRVERARGCTTAVHLLSAEEAKSLFEDVVNGLAFLHDRSILHLDLKPGNVLLTWDEGMLIPRAMLSDFGTSQDMLQPTRNRSGNTGTLEYAAPESLPSPSTGLLSPVDSKADMWSLGMILHILLFFRLPYRYSSSGDARTGDGDDMKRLEAEILDYGGFKSSPAVATTFESRNLPQAYLVLLESLLNTKASMRPSSERVVRGIREGNLDPLPTGNHTGTWQGTLIPRLAPTSVSEAPAGVYIQDGDGAQQDSSYFNGEDADTPTGALFMKERAVADEKTLLIQPPQEPPASLMSPFTFHPPPWLWFLSDVGTSMTRLHFIRGLKSCILVAKILMLQATCPESRPEPGFMYFVLLLAVIDTWFEGLWSSLAFGIVHVAILRSNCGGSNCCV